MNEMKHASAFQWALSILGITTLLFTLFAGNAGWMIFLLCCIIVTGAEYLFKTRENKTFTPYMFMLLSPLLLVHYSSITDFQIRILCFVFFIYILYGSYSVDLAKRSNIRRLLGGATGSPFKIYFTAFLIFALVSTVLYFRGIHLSGDEPHYLVITQSLVEDGDFDLKNNFLEKTYLDYIPVEVPHHGGEIDGKYRSFHMPGVSFLMLPFYLLFKLTGGFIPPALFFRLAASAVNAFFALALFYLLRLIFTGKDISGGWLLLLCIFPLAFHSVHLYPELPAAALMIAAYYTSLSARRNILLGGLFLSLVPWFHVKYIPPLLVLTAAILYDLLKPFKRFHFDKEKLKRLALFFIFPVLSMILLALYCKLLYNTYSPTDIFPKESYLTVPWLLRLKVFLAYFLDQRDGLLFYSPLFFLAFWGLRKKLKGGGLLLGMAAAYIFFHAFTTVRGAYSPAGRPLMFVSWIFIIFILHFYFNILKGEAADPPPLLHFFFKLSAGFSIFVTAWFFYYPLFMYQPVFSHTMERASGLNLFLGSSSIPLWKFFPSFLTSPESGHPANFVWLGLLLFALLLYYIKTLKRVTKPLKGMRKEILTVSLFLIFSFLYCYHPHVLLLPQNKYTGKTISFFNNSKNFRYMEKQEGFRIKGGNNYDIFIDRKMAAKKNITFRFSHTDVVDVTVRNGKRELFRSDKQETNSFSLNISSLKTLKVGNRVVSHLGFETQTTEKNAFLFLKFE
ncbi:MAG: hypothetical protein GY950_15010 [bacterium]|nr:hypothetical protein [bacterium]